MYENALKKYTKAHKVKVEQNLYLKTRRVDYFRD